MTVDLFPPTIIEVTFDQNDQILDSPKAPMIGQLLKSFMTEQSIN